MLKVLLDARKINDGGIGTYIRNLLSALGSNKECSFTLIVSEQQHDLSTGCTQIIDNSKPYSIDEYLSLGRRLDTACYDLYHSPHFTLPYFLKCPSVITIHDTIHLSAPESWYYPLIGRKLISSAASRAKKIILVSQASKDDFLRHFPQFSSRPEKINVIENSISADLIRTPINIAANQLPEDFILSVISQNKPHKGLADLLLAYQMAQRSNQLPDLVLAGNGVQDFMENNSSLLEEYKKTGIHFAGKVSNQLLRSMYLKARVLLVVSRIEGFGLTALEAKAIGCPVLTRPLPSVIEMLDDKDLIAKDMSVAALAECISAVRARFSTADGRTINNAVCTKYSQENLASKTLEVYRQALVCR